MVFKMQCYCGCNKKVVAIILAGTTQYPMCEQCAIDHLINNKKARGIYNAEYNKLQFPTNEIQ
jgi:hypothetical protein